jgi:hypothetical protein
VNSQPAPSLHIQYVDFLTDPCDADRVDNEGASSGGAKETKNQRFRRLAAARGDRILKEIGLLGNLSNDRNYEYSSEEVQKVFAAIEAELKDCRSKFVTTPRKRKIEF